MKRDKKERNYIGSMVIFTLLLFGTLSALYFLPNYTIKGYTFKRVDLFSEIRQEEPEDSLSLDTLPLPPIQKPLFVDTCRIGLACIEDYADSTQRGMKPFYTALDSITQANHPVRIAFFGDSFIEADIFTADFRSMLQDLYGGCGVGFITITSGTSGYRPTVRHSFGGWKSHCVTDSAHFDSRQSGPSGHYYLPKANAYVQAKGQKNYGNHLDTCQMASLYFINQGAVAVTAQINGQTTAVLQALSTGQVQHFQVKGNIGAIKWNVIQADSTRFFGMAMDGKQGITVDNFSLRGSSGLSLRNIPSSTLKQFNDLRPYDLIILQYGLNVATKRGVNYDRYKTGMLTAIAHLKTCFPQSGILLLSVGDREYKTETGDLRTMPGVKNLIRYQQSIAAESNIAYWNMFDAMGGEGSMARMVHAKPALANYDYTHINFRGGKHIAELLFETLKYGKEQHDKRRQHEQ